MLDAVDDEMSQDINSVTISAVIRGGGAVALLNFTMDGKDIRTLTLVELVTSDVLTKSFKDCSPINTSEVDVLPGHFLPKIGLDQSDWTQYELQCPPNTPNGPSLYTFTTCGDDIPPLVKVPDSKIATFVNVAIRDAYKTAKQQLAADGATQTSFESVSLAIHGNAIEYLFCTRGDHEIVHVDAVTSAN